MKRQCVHNAHPVRDYIEGGAYPQPISTAACQPRCAAERALVGLVGLREPDTPNVGSKRRHGCIVCGGRGVGPGPGSRLRELSPGLRIVFRPIRRACTQSLGARGAADQEENNQVAAGVRVQ